MAPTILPNVRYRIQNVDFGTFLERRNRNELLMRPMKETLQQQWFFFENPADGTFRILNAEERGYILEAIGSGTSFSVAIARARNAQAPQWQLAYDPSKELYIVSADVGNDNVLLSCDSLSGRLNLEQDSTIRNIRNISKEENYQWRILEDSPASLPDTDGKYRIRTLNGYAIHSEPGQTTISIANQERGNHRAWEITSLGNGKCTIKNVQENAFLATTMIDNEWAPVLSNNLPAPEWDIASLGNMTYSIIVWRMIDDTRELRRLSLTLKDDTIILKPMKSAHNQLWFIEATDARLDSSQPQPQPTPPTPSRIPAPVPTATTPGGSVGPPKLLIGLVEAEYLLLSDIGQWIYISSSDQNVFLDATQKTSFKVELVDNTGVTPGKAKVYLIHLQTNKYLAYSTIGSGYIIVLSDWKMPWRLVAVPGDALRFTILDDSSSGWGLRAGTFLQPTYDNDRSGGYQYWTLQPKST